MPFTGYRIELEPDDVVVPIVTIFRGVLGAIVSTGVVAVVI